MIYLFLFGFRCFFFFLSILFFSHCEGEILRIFSMAHMGERQGECFNFSYLLLVWFEVVLLDYPYINNVVQFSRFISNTSEISTYFTH